MEQSATARIPDACGVDGGTVLMRSIAEDVEDYTTSVAGVEVEAVRAGPGGRPSEVLASVSDRFILTSSRIGFPMLSRTHVADHQVCVAYMAATTPGSRWCEMNLDPGAVVAYAPSAEHTARNLAGTHFMFVVSDLEQITGQADALGVGIDLPARGEVHLLAPTARTALVGPAFQRCAAHSTTGSYPRSTIADDVLRAMVHALSERIHPRRIGTGRRIDRRHVVHECIDYAELIGRIPSIIEMCLVAHVSERTLRDAFNEEYQVAPTQFFRFWALTEAHHRLCSGDAERVTDVAAELGFEHLGRFALRYREVYGESPSSALRRNSRATLRTRIARETDGARVPEGVTLELAAIG
jgi:AraC-like DNA-binding protein